MRTNKTFARFAKEYAVKYRAVQETGEHEFYIEGTPFIVRINSMVVRGYSLLRNSGALFVDNIHVETLKGTADTSFAARAEFCARTLCEAERIGAHELLNQKIERLREAKLREQSRHEECINNLNNELRTVRNAMKETN